jgi:large subunit ribosomal protein L24
MHVKKDDVVQVIAGDDAPKTGRVLSVLPKEGKVVVEGINRVYKHLKPSRRNPQGGRLSKEMPVDASNVLLFCGNCKRGVRIGRRYLADGSKERYCKSCDAALGRLSKPRETYAEQEEQPQT